MYITARQAYLAAFQILDEIFDEKQDMRIGNFLSGMNPYAFKDFQAADPAVWAEWAESSKTLQNHDTLTDRDAFQLLVAFLCNNEKQFGYNINTILTTLQPHPYQTRWHKLCENAQLLTGDNQTSKARDI